MMKLSKILPVPSSYNYFVPVHATENLQGRIRILFFLLFFKIPIMPTLYIASVPSHTVVFLGSTLPYVPVSSAMSPPPPAVMQSSVSRWLSLSSLPPPPNVVLLLAGIAVLPPPLKLVLLQVVIAVLLLLSSKTRLRTRWNWTGPSHAAMLNTRLAVVVFVPACSIRGSKSVVNPERFFPDPATT